MKGFGLIETIVAIGLFSVLISAGTMGFIPALKSGRSGREQTQATNLAREGLEAARSIRDRNFTNLTSGTFGIGISSSLWSFSGSSDTFDKFIRKLNVSQASRDAGGSLVSVGGTTDPDTFLVNSQITWNNSIGDTRRLSVDSVLTNWRKSIGGVSYDALVVYGNGTVTTPRYRTYTDTSNTFAVFANGAAGGNPRSVVVRTSPTKTEAIIGTINNTGSLSVYCFDGTTWSLDWTAGVGVTATTRPFNLEYETNSGDVLVLYGNGTITTNEMVYRTKSGASGCGAASWSGATSFDPLRTSNKIQWVKMARDRRSSSNLIATSWADNANDLSAAIWDGSTLINEPTAASETTLEIGTTTATVKQGVDSFDLEYESLTADLMLIWGISTGTNGTNGVRYRLCSGGTSSCTWGAVTTPPTFADDATNLDISANPLSDEMRFASIGNAGSDLQTGYWTGVGWTNTANLDTAAQAPLVGTHLVATGWLNSGATKRSVIVYNDSAATNIGWYVCTLATCALQTDFTPAPTFTNPQKWYEIVMDPLHNDRFMFLTSDNTNRLFAKRLVMTSVPAFTWTNADGSANIGTTLSQNTTSPYGFAYWYQ